MEELFFKLTDANSSITKIWKIDYDLSIDFTILVLKLMRNQMLFKIHFYFYLVNLDQDSVHGVVC